MKKLNLLIFITIFFLTGEILIRIDKNYDLLNNAPQIIAIEMEQSQEKQDIDNGKFQINPQQFRVIVIGDSYIYGGGIDPQKKFSKILQANYINDKQTDKELVVLDISQPNNNTLDNYNYFKHYNNFFKPHAVIWTYNYEDILGDLEFKKNSSVVSNTISSQTLKYPKQTIKKISTLKSFTKKLYKLSELLSYISVQIQKELKINGIVLPVGDFYYLTHKAYNKESFNWKLSKEIFVDVLVSCQENNTYFIVYKLPEFNLLKKNSLFSKIDCSLINFFSNNPYINYLDGYNDFMGVNNEMYMLSKYDGHPNEKAHKKIADIINKELAKIRPGITSEVNY